MGLFGGCNTGCNTGCGTDSWIWIIIVLCCSGCFNVCDILDDICGDESVIWIILILFCVCGKNHRPMPIASPCGC